MAKSKIRVVANTFTVANVLTPQKFTLTPDAGYRRVTGVALATMSGDKAFTMNVQDGEEAVVIAPLAAGLLDGTASYGPIDDKFISVDVEITNRDITFYVTRQSLLGTTQLINIGIRCEA